jgi:hypothetical protein
MGSPFLALTLAGIINATVVPVPVGGQVRIRLPAQQRIAEAFSPNDRVAEMVPEGQAVIKVTGKAPGFNPLVLTDDSRQAKLFLVVVPKANK